jgi:hypothetical protein
MRRLRTLFLLGREKPCMRTLVAGDAASSFGTCSKLLSHGRVIYQIGILDASEKNQKNQKTNSMRNS